MIKVCGSGNEKEEFEKLKKDCLSLEEQVKLLLGTELKLRRTQADLIENKKKLAEYNRTLEQKVQDRTAELRSLNEELVSFAYIVSHDLKAPLRKINVFGSRLKEDYFHVLDDTGKDYIERMQKSSERMQALINDLLEYSRVMTHPDDASVVHLGDSIKDVLADLEVQSGYARAEFDIGPLPSVHANPTRIRQLFQNLISNSLKFRKNDIDPKIRIYAEPNEGDGYIKIMVNDNGIGIDEQHFNQIFDVFCKLHKSSEYEGSGIGLSICKKIVERYGGKIEVRSGERDGTTFTIMWPV